MSPLERTIIQIKEYLSVPHDTEELSTRYKYTLTALEPYKPGSPEHKVLSKFRDSLLKELRKLRKGKTIEQMDEETLTKLEAQE